MSMLKAPYLPPFGRVPVLPGGLRIVTVGASRAESSSSSSASRALASW